MNQPRDRARHTDAIDKIGMAILHESHAILTREWVLRFQERDSGQSWKLTHKLVIWQLLHLEPKWHHAFFGRSNEPHKSDGSTWVLIRNPSHAPCMLDRQPVSLLVGEPA